MAHYNNKLPCNKDLAMNNIAELVLLNVIPPTPPPPRGNYLHKGTMD